MSDLDKKLYALFNRCAEADLPISFCGADDARKWELFALLRKQLSDAESQDHEQAVQG